MVEAGIEAMNVFGGTAFLDVRKLAEHRKLDMSRFDNLLMKEKAVALPCEDPITCAVNAARPLVDDLDSTGRDSIEMVITCSESGIDFGKSMSTYVRELLGLQRNCRVFELKQACYSGTAGLQTALNFVLSQTSPGAKALVIATDISRFFVEEGGELLTEDWSYFEPSAGAGAVAMLVSEQARVFQIDFGANGYYGYEVMDTCRPTPDSEAGDADLSLLSYLDCCEQTFLNYKRRVIDVDYRDTFQFLAFHTPFGGMVKGAHRAMMRKQLKARPPEIEADFHERVMPGLTYCQRVGNIMGGTVFMALASTIDNGQFPTPRRVGMFSYGSGCCSEFYSGVVTPEAQVLQRGRGIQQSLDARYELSMDDYEKLLRASIDLRFGTRNVVPDFDLIPGAVARDDSTPRLYLKQIREFHREYEWR